MKFIDQEQLKQWASTTCVKKKQYRKKQAQKAAARINKHSVQKVVVFECMVCKKWHIGKPYVFGDISEGKCKRLSRSGNKFAFKNEAMLCTKQCGGGYVKKCNVCRHWHIVSTKGMEKNRTVES